jgi:predicted nucleic acid-binding protein
LGRKPRCNASGPFSGPAMILVDASVWIAHLRGHRTEATAKLKVAAMREPLLIGDLILLEVLQGARNEAHALRIERGLRSYAIVPLLDAELAPHAARNYRKLRELGITIRKTADLIIGTFCIEHRHSLLHDDRDFAPMERHLGLKVV